MELQECYRIMEKRLIREMFSEKYNKLKEYYRHVEPILIKEGYGGMHNVKVSLL